MLSYGLALCASGRRIQGVADTLTWGTAAFASLASGLIVAAASYTVLGFIGVGLTLIPALFLAIQIPRLRPAAAA